MCCMNSFILAKKRLYKYFNLFFFSFFFWWEPTFWLPASSCESYAKHPQNISSFPSIIQLEGSQSHGHVTMHHFKVLFSFPLPKLWNIGNASNIIPLVLFFLNESFLWLSTVNHMCALPHTSAFLRFLLHYM